MVGKVNFKVIESTVSAEQRAILKAQTKETLAKWWCDLNIHGWPRKLGKRGNEWAIMCLIAKAIGKKACLAEWRKRCAAAADAGERKQT